MRHLVLVDRDVAAQSSSRWHPVRYLRSLRRHTSSGMYLPEIDGLRFIAILSVFLYHLAGDVLRHTPSATAHPNTFVFRLSQQLNIGVPLFFVISGFILGLPFAKSHLQRFAPISLRRYFLRRLTRLEPPYIIALLLFFGLKVLSSRGQVASLVPHFVASLFYVHNLIYQEPSAINFVAWSLEVEVQFYLLAPLLSQVFCIRSVWIRRGVLAIAVAVATMWANAHVLNPLVRLSLAGNIQFFLTGFLLTDILVLAPPESRRTWRWDIVTALGWPFLVIVLASNPDAIGLLLPGIILLLYCAGLYGKKSSAALGSVWTASIGGMCYTIYLLHNYAIATLGFLSERLGQHLPFDVCLILQFLLMAPAVAAASIVYYRLIEQPCMRSDWPHRLHRRMTRAVQRLRPAAVPV